MYTIQRGTASKHLLSSKVYKISFPGQNAENVVSYERGHINHVSEQLVNRFQNDSHHK